MSHPSSEGSRSDRGSLRRLVPGRSDASGCLIIAEVAQSHDGSLGQAHAFVEAASRAGVDAIKFQTHIAAAESTPSEPWRVRFSLQDATRYDYWRRMQFTKEQWAGLARHAEECGLLFLSSPFSMEAVDLLESIGMRAWKIASGEVGNRALLERTASTKAPVLLSSGMSSFAELDEAVDLVRSFGSEVAVLQCVTAYPCPPELVGLNVIPVLRERYGCLVGLSDHSATIFPGIAAATLDIDVLEVHLALGREMFGPDVAASVTTDELRTLVEGVRFVERMVANPVDKDRTADEMSPMRELFTKSVVAATDLARGTVLEREHLAEKKPGTGIPASRLPSVVGRRLRRPLQRDELLSEDDFEGQGGS